MESQPQNPEFRINPENFHPCWFQRNYQNPSEYNEETPQSQTTNKPKVPRGSDKHARIQMGDQGSGPPPPPLENHKNIGFISNTGSDPLKSHIAIKPAFNEGPSSARQRNAIKMAFRWRVDDGLLIVVFSQKKKNKEKLCQSWLDPLWRNFLDPRMTKKERKQAQLDCKNKSKATSSLSSAK